MDADERRRSHRLQEQAANVAWAVAVLLIVAIASYVVRATYDAS